MRAFVPFVPLLGLSLCLTACGGGTAVAAPPVPEAIATPPRAAGGVGVYDINYGRFMGVYTFLDNGDFYGLHIYYDQNGPLILGHPYAHLASTNDLDHPTALTWANFVDDDYRVGMIDRQGALGREFAADGLHVHLISATVGDAAAVAQFQKMWTDGSSQSVYGNPIPTAQLAGAYAGYWRSAGLGERRRDLESFSIAPDGKVQGSSVGCTVQGQMRQHGNTGIFDAELQATGGPCGPGLALTGIVTPLAYAQGKATLAFQVHSPQAILVFLVKQQ